MYNHSTSFSSLKLQQKDSTLFDLKKIATTTKHNFLYTNYNNNKKYKFLLRNYNNNNTLYFNKNYNYNNALSSKEKMTKTTKHCCF